MYLKIFFEKRENLFRFFILYFLYFILFTCMTAQKYVIQY